MTGTKDFPLVITRTLNAPRDLVWDCYSKLEHLKKWWGPVGFEWIHGSLEFKPGGMFHYGMRGPNGVEMWGRFVYQAIAKPETIDFINSFSDPSGGIAKPPYPGMENFPLRSDEPHGVRGSRQPDRTRLQGRPAQCLERRAQIL